MRKVIFLILMFTASHNATGQTLCTAPEQCQNAMQTHLYEHWKARYSYPTAEVALLIQNNLAGTIQVEIEKSSGFEEFDQSAVKAITESLAQLDFSQLSSQQQKQFRRFRLKLIAE